MDLENYYEHIYRAGKLRTVQQAQGWSDGVLRTLGIILDRRTKRSLAKALPDELARSVNDVFWLVNFRDPNLSRDEFLQKAGRRSGNSNSEFAIYPARAVFSAIKGFLDSDLQDRIAQSLSPEMREFWEQANSVSKAVSEAQ